MRKLVAGLVFLSLTSGSCGFAQDAGTAAFRDEIPAPRLRVGF